jgi:formate/nitrite transporter
MIAILVMAGALDNFAGIKILQGISFAAALSLIVFAGSELFTGNVFVMTAGLMWKTTKLRESIAICAFCYLGNFVGSIFIASLFWGTGYLHGKVLTEAASAITAKTDPYFYELLIRGFLCNVLVCLAVWMAFAAKDVIGKCVSIWIPVMLFVAMGYEHSIANMFFVPAAIFSGANVTWVEFAVNNLIPATLGNIVGGALFVGCLYWYIYLND